MEAMLVRCANCGKEADVLATGMCVPCELEIQAREKPKFLKDMEALYAGQHPQDDGQRALQALLHKKPTDFITQMRAAQREYDAKMQALEEIKARQVKVTEPSGSVEVDEGGERVEELIERLLKEAAS